MQSDKGHLELDTKLRACRKTTSFLTPQTQCQGCKSHQQQDEPGAVGSKLLIQKTQERLRAGQGQELPELSQD